MKLSVVVAAALLCSAFALDLVKSSDGSGVLAFPIQRTTSRSVQHDLDNIAALKKRRLRRHLDKRTVTLSLDNPKSHLLYWANITIGTPAQSLALQIDTGSSDIWVEVAQSELCSQSDDPCEGNTYDNTTSSSYKYSNSDFVIQYGDGSYAIGDYATETLAIGNATVTGQTFAMGLNTTSSQGVMGIGYAANEAYAVYYEHDSYPNLVETMKDQGLINTLSYSLYLNDLDAETGEIIFGGVDSAKYTGQLTSLPIDTIPGVAASTFTVSLTGMSLLTPGSSSASAVSSSTFPIPVLLDSGSSYMALPTVILQSLASSLGATYSRQLGTYIFKNCDLQNEDGSVVFSFGTKNVSVPYNEFIVNPTDTDGNVLTYTNGQEVCQIGIIASDDPTTYILGDTFLRSAYVVYDLENNEISIAQTDFNSTDSNVLAITSGTNGVPGATPVSSITRITSVATGIATRVGTNAAGTITPTDGSSDSSSAIGFASLAPSSVFLGVFFAFVLGTLTL